MTLGMAALTLAPVGGAAPLPCRPGPDLVTARPRFRPTLTRRDTMDTTTTEQMQDRDLAPARTTPREWRTLAAELAAAGQAEAAQVAYAEWLDACARQVSQ